MNTPASGGRTAYHAPVLRDHGTVAEITLTKFGHEWDGAGYAGYGSHYSGTKNPTS